MSISIQTAYQITVKALLQVSGNHSPGGKDVSLALIAGAQNPNDPAKIVAFDAATDDVDGLRVAEFVAFAPAGFDQATFWNIISGLFTAANGGTAPASVITITEASTIDQIAADLSNEP